MVSEIASVARVLVVGGVANLVLSFLLGWVLSGHRMRGPVEPHRWLLVAHEVSLQEGLMLLGLAAATPWVALPPSQAAIAAWLLVVASAFQDGSAIANWLRRTSDQFKERSTGWVLATVNAVLNTVGLVWLAVGVARGLV